MSNSLGRFEEVADSYGEFATAIPKYEVMRRRIREIMRYWGELSAPEFVCELGTGPGRYAETVIEEFTPDRFVGVDAVEGMVRESKKRLTDLDVVTDIQIERSHFEDWEPSCPFDWVYSSLSIHHMSDLEMRDLFSRIYENLKPDGKFLLCDLVRVSGKSRHLYRKIYTNRLEKKGLSQAQIDDRWRQHEENDRPAGLRPMMRWLREVGFRTVECLWKDMNRAIIIAMKKGMTSIE